jgi:signal transduction histidine kinase
VTGRPLGPAAPVATPTRREATVAAPPYVGDGAARAPSDGAPPGAARQPRLSIRLRLTLWYGGTILVLLLAGIAVLRGALRRTLDAEFRESLASAASFVHQFFRVELDEYPSVDSTIAHIAGELVFPDRGVEFVRADGTVFRAPGAPHSRATLAPPVRVLVRPLDPQLAPGWRIRVRASAADLARVERRLDLWFGVSVLAAALGAAAVGWWLAGRTLRPVGAMADAAEHITAARSSARLPVANPHDELGRLGTRFNALLERLDGALSQQRRFLADAAHELRTPIARMRSAVEVALLAPPGPADRAALEHVGADVENISTLVGQLLQLARADVDAQEAHPVRGFLDDAVVDALAPWRAPAAAAGVSLTVSVLEEVPAVFDPVLLQRLLGTLVDNAIRYTPAGGAVDVRVRRDGATAVLEVEDTGIGIQPDERAHVFERFYRGTAARQRAPDGSGLGLPIARAIVAQHGGSIVLAPARGGGTLVRVTLPTAPPA